MHQTNSPQCIILKQKCAHSVRIFLLQNGALCDMGLGHIGRNIWVTTVRYRYAVTKSESNQWWQQCFDFVSVYVSSSTLLEQVLLSWKPFYLECNDLLPPAVHDSSDGVVTHSHFRFVFVATHLGLHKAYSKMAWSSYVVYFYKHFTLYSNPHLQWYRATYGS